MRFFPVVLTCLGAVLLSLPGVCAADLIASVKVEGVLMDTELYRLPGVTVSARSMASGKEWQVKSDHLGRFDLGQLPLGEYGFRGNSADGTELFDVTYNIGDRIVITSAGKSEQIIIVVGRGVRSMHTEAAAKAAKSRSPGRAVIPGHAPPSRRNVNVILGSRHLDDNWRPMEDQTALGIRVDHEYRDFPLHLVWGLHASWDDSSELGQPFHLTGDVDVTILELSFGVMKLWDRAARFRSYISTGVSLVHVELEGDQLICPRRKRDPRCLGQTLVHTDNNDESFGVFVEVGMFWQLPHGINIGIDTRHLLLTGLAFDHGDPIIQRVDVDVNYFQVGLLVGWGW